MRRRIKIVLIVLLLMTVSYVGWIVFDKINNRARKESNENNVVKLLKEIHKAQIKAKEKHGKYIAFEELEKENNSVSKIKNNYYSGYVFVANVQDNDYIILANRDIGEGTVSFFLDSSGIIRASSKTVAGHNDPPTKIQDLSN